MHLLVVSLFISAATATDNFAFAPPVSQFPGIDPALVVAASFSPPAPLSLGSPSFSPSESFSSSEAFAPPPSESLLPLSVENPPFNYQVMSFSPPVSSFSSIGTELFAPPSGAFAAPSSEFLAPPLSSSNAFSPPASYAPPPATTSYAPIPASAPYAPPPAPASNAPPPASAPYAPSPPSAPYAPPSPIPNAPYAPPAPPSFSNAPPIPVKRVRYVPAFSIPHAPPSFENARPATPATSYGPPGYVSPPLPAPPPPPPPPPPKVPAAVYGVPFRQGLSQYENLNQHFLRFDKPNNIYDDAEDSEKRSFNGDDGIRFIENEDF